MRGQKKEYQCKCCNEFFVARVADRKRGWARFCSKSCKAKNGKRLFLKYVQPHIDEYTVDDYHDDIHPFSDEAFE